MSTEPDITLPPETSPDTSTTGEPAPFRYWETPVEPGRTLIEASAGTGKTFAIAGLVLRLVLEGDTLTPPKNPKGDRGDESLPDLRRLLVVTFTRAATDELRTRIRSALRATLRAVRGESVPEAAVPLVAPFADAGFAPDAERRLLAALDRVDEARIDTIHGFCQNVLEEAAFESGTPFDLTLDEDGTELLRRAATDTWSALAYDAPNLAELAVRLGWDLDALLLHLTRVRRFPNTRVLPEAPPLDAARAALGEAARALGNVWNAEAVTGLLAELKWNKNAPLAPPAGSAVLRRVTDFASGNAGAVEAVLACTPEAIANNANKRGKARKEYLETVCNHPAIAACGRVKACIETVRRSLIHAFVDEASARARRLKDRRAVADFDDLLTRLHHALHHPDTGDRLAALIQERIGVAVVDEFQDTNPIQYGILRRAFDGLPLYLIGDPKQAIYSFRGADVHAYLDAQSEADRRFTLGTNWRSTAGLVQAVNGLFEAAERPFLYHGIAFHPAEAAPHHDEPRLTGDGRPALVWWQIPPKDTGKPMGKGDATDAVLRAVAGEVTRLLRTEVMLEECPLAAGDMAVLVRSNRQARRMQDLFRAAGVPAVVGEAGDIRETREMEEIERLLHAMARPADGGALRAALATELWGWTAPEVAALDDAPDALDALRHRLREAQRTWRRHGVLRALTAFFEAENVSVRLLAFRDGERRLTNLRYAAEILHEVEQAGGRSPDEMLRWLRRRMEHALGGRDRAELRLESDAAAVQITTLHKSKGLEYDVVFLPTLWAGRKASTDPPLAHTDDGVVYHIDPSAPEHAALQRRADAEELADAIRLAYVGLTRARERVYVPWGAVNQSERSPLAYLLQGHRAAASGGEFSSGNGAAGSGAAGESLSRELGARVEAARRLAKDEQSDAGAAVRALAARHSACMTVEPLPAGAPPLDLTDDSESATPALAARPLPEAAAARIRAPWRPVSFSAWVAEVSAGDEPAPSTAFNAPAADEPPAPDDASADPDEATGLHAFAAGRLAGRCLHEVLQYVDFQRVGAGGSEEPSGTETPPEPVDGETPSDPTAEIIRRALTTHGLLDAHRHRSLPGEVALDPEAAVMEMVHRLTHAPLLDGPTPETPDAADALLTRNTATLSDVPSAQCVPEWRFVLPLGRLVPADFAQAFRDYADTPHTAAYAETVAQLPAETADGLLTGIADLVVSYASRWTVIDWKSNRLGPNASAYAEEALRRAMHDHHYVLQMHLYVLGLHRHLRTRLGANYDYDRHVGGSRTVFLRGVTDGAGSGVVTDRPPRALIEALDSLIDESP